jgi:VWFA-related protein
MRCAFILAFALSLAAQESRFDVRSRLVLVPATVTDAKGRFIDGLEASDFLVLDNGRAQKVAVDTMATGVAPIALVIAVQSSGISVAVLEKVRKIGVMIQPLVTGERGCAALVSFADRLSWLQDCTNDPDVLGRAFDQLRPGENKEARMLDAAHAAIRRLRDRPDARRVLLLISESRDRGSETDLDTVTAAAQSAGVTVYTATYSALKTGFTSKSPVSDPPRAIKPKTPNDNMGTVDGNPPSKYNRKIAPPAEHQVDVLGAIGELARLGTTNTAQALATGTGGTTLPFTRQKGLSSAIEKLGAELHTQYVLSFVPAASAPGYHGLEVRVNRHGEFRIRARPGYWSEQ